MVRIRGVKFQENLKNDMGLEFYDLSHPWGLGQPCWPYFEDVKIERLHNMAKSGVLTQRITTVMHSGTHIDAPADYKLSFYKLCTAEFAHEHFIQIEEVYKWIKDQFPQTSS